HFKQLARNEGPVGTATVDPSGVTITSDSGAQRIPVRVGQSSTLNCGDQLLFVDWTYHYQPDLVVAGSSGLAFFRQGPGHKFEDVTAKTGLPAAILKGTYSGVWPIDIESDSDLDIVLGTKAGPPVVLRNNDDGTFAPISPFKGVSGVTAFAWLDIDQDYA